ncbi:MAG: hypothetical protein ACFCU1_11150 [Sumerlaeia bacterium]
MKLSLLPACLMALLTPLSAMTTFTTPVELTPGGELFQLSQTPTRTAAFSSDGSLHVVYWAGASESTLLTPSTVYYQSRTPQGAWGALVELDANATIDQGSGPQKIGGRHPNLGLGANGDLWVVWHDYRHVNPNPPGNGVDNIEVYAQLRPFGGGAPQEFRLTNTAAPHFGDNSYLPRLAILPNGSFSVLWYDFNANADVSDLYALHTANLATYSPEPIGSLRLTVETSRPGNTLERPYSAADFLADSTNTLHAVWTSQFDTEAPVWYSTVPNPSTTVSEEQLFATSGGFIDPPRLVLAPNDDLWVVVKSGSPATIQARRKPAALQAFEAPLTLVAAGSNKQPSLAVDSAGALHLSWISGGNTVNYRKLTQSGTPVENATLATGENYQRTNLLLGPSDEPIVFFDALSSGSEGAVFVVQQELPAATVGWAEYE